MLSLIICTLSIPIYLPTGFRWNFRVEWHEHDVQLPHYVPPFNSNLVDQVMDSSNATWRIRDERVIFPYIHGFSHEGQTTTAYPYIATLIILVLAYLSTLPYREIFYVPDKLKDNIANAVPTIPYWIPYFGVRRSEFLQIIMLSYTAQKSELHLDGIICKNLYSLDCQSCSSYRYLLLNLRPCGCRCAEE